MKVAVFNTDGTCKALFVCQECDVEANLAFHPGLEWREITDERIHLPQSVPNLSELT